MTIATGGREEGGRRAGGDVVDVDVGYGYHEDRTPIHGYAAMREDAMTAFAKSWRRE